METLWQDLRYGVRQLARSPGFTAVAVLTLALGIGANTALFSVVDAVLLRPLAVPNPDQLVRIETRTTEGGLHSDFSYPLYVTLRKNTELLSGWVAYSDGGFGISAGGQTERVQGEYVSANYFSVLGLPPHLGAAFVPEDEEAGARRVVMVSHGFWRRVFGGDPGVVGKTLVVNGRGFEVIGVLSAGYRGFTRGLVADLWIPLPHYEELNNSPNTLSDLRTNWLSLAGRLRSGVTMPQAQEHLTRTLPEGFEAARGQGTWEAALSPAAVGNDFYVAELTLPLQLLFAAVALVLLIACANVASLLLVRAQARQREISIRLSLGATRRRMGQQLITESLLLCVMGGVAALLLGLWATEVFSGAAVWGSTEAGFDLRLDARVVGFTAGLSFLTALACGVFPAFSASRTDLMAMMKTGDATPAAWRFVPVRNALVVLQLSLSFVLLVGAGLFLRSLDRLYAIDTGFSGENVFALSMDLELRGYTPVQGRDFYLQALEDIGGVPGVASLSAASALPVTPGGRRMEMPPNFTRPPVDREVSIDVVTVAPRFFETLGLPLVSGREFSPREDAAPALAIVNETMARTFWPGADPVGQTFFTGYTTFHVVGVARGTKYRDLREAPRMTMYLPLSQAYTPRMNLLVRSAAPPAALLPALRQRLHELDPDLPVFDVRTLPEHVGRSLYVERLRSVLLSVFGLLALSLAAVGLYGLVSHAVARRTHEIGIRIALGAQRWQVLQFVLLWGLKLVALGLAAGLAGSYWLSRVLASQLYELAPEDPVAFGGTILLLTGVALAACLIPARRAARVDPMVALRYE
jgi:predicted permease